MTENAKEVVVVGGGLIGSACAFFLAKEGAKVTLIDRRPLGENASGWNAGNLNPIYLSSPKLINFAIDCLNSHFQLNEQLQSMGCGWYSFERVKRVLLATNAREYDELVQTSKLFQQHENFSAKFLDHRDIASLDQRVSDEFSSGLLLQGNMAINSYFFNVSLIQALLKFDGSVSRSDVYGIERFSGHLELKTSLGSIRADAVVLATGPWSDLCADLGFSLPVKPLKGEILRMKLMPHGINHDWTYAGTTLYRRGNEEVWLGATKEDAGFDEMPSEVARQNLMRSGLRMMPNIADAVLIEHSASLRAVTMSGLPVISRAPGWDNLFVANGGGHKGALLCTGVAKAIADLVYERAVQLDLPAQSI